MPAQSKIAGPKMFKHAFLVHDVKVGFHVFMEDDMIMRIAECKQFWLLDGRFSENDLVRWADDIRNHRMTTINAMINTVKIDSKQWKEMSKYFDEELAYLKKGEYDAIKTALLAITEGHVKKGEQALRNAGIIQ